MEMKGILIHWSCIVSLVFSPSIFTRAKAELNIEQKKTNALKAQSYLADCKKNLNDQRGVLDQIKVGMVTEVAESMPANCDQKNNLNKFVQDIAKVKSSIQKKNGVSVSSASVQFAKALRMQTLKNSLMTFMDADLRYNLNYPHAQGLHKIGTVASMFCENKNHQNTCSKSEKVELEKEALNYGRDFHKSNQKTYSAMEAKKELNHRFASLIPELSKINSEIKIKNQLFNQDEIKPKKSFLKETSEATRDGIAETTDRIKKNAKMGAKDALISPLAKKKKDLEDQFIQDSQEGLGLLLYTKTMRENNSVNIHHHLDQEKLINQAVQEIKSETLKLAHDTNEQLQDFKFGESATGKVASSAGALASEVLLPGSSLLFGSPIDFEKALKNMLKTNPIAAGQVLTEHPELVGVVCKITSEIAFDDAKDRAFKKGLEVVTWGGMVVGGVLILTGVGSVAGVAIEGAAATAITTLEAVNVGINTASLVGGLGYTAKRHFDLKEENAQIQEGLLAKTGGSLKQLKANDAELDQEAMEITKTIVFAGAPIGLGKLANWARASALLKDTKVVKFFGDMSEELHARPHAVVGLRTLDYTCMVMGVVSCNMVTSGLHLMPKSKQLEILEDPKKLESFTEKTLNENRRSIAPDAPKNQSVWQYLKQKFNFVDNDAGLSKVEVEKRVATHVEHIEKLSGNSITPELRTLVEKNHQIPWNVLSKVELEQVQQSLDHFGPTKLSKNPTLLKEYAKTLAAIKANPAFPEAAIFASTYFKELALQSNGESQHYLKEMFQRSKLSAEDFKVRFALDIPESVKQELDFKATKETYHHDLQVSDVKLIETNKEQEAVTNHAALVRPVKDGAPLNIAAQRIYKKDGTYVLHSDSSNKNAGSAGYFSSSKRVRILVDTKSESIINVSNEDVKSGKADGMVFKHEVRHWKYNFNRKNGKNSPFDSKIYSLNDQPITQEATYSKYQSFEEVSTYAKGVIHQGKKMGNRETLEKFKVNNDLPINEVINKAPLEHQIKMLKNTANATLETTERALNKVYQAMDAKTSNSKAVELITYTNGNKIIQVSVDDQFKIEIPLSKSEYQMSRVNQASLLKMAQAKLMESKNAVIPVVQANAELEQFVNTISKNKTITKQDYLEFVDKLAKPASLVNMNANR